MPLVPERCAVITIVPKGPAMTTVEHRGCFIRLFVASLLVASPVYAQSDPLAGLDAYIRESMTDWQVPGLAIVIVKDDSVVFIKGFGVREVRKAALVDGQTMFAIGSNTKTFTAAAVGMLVDDEKMSWDDPVVKHLPWFQLSDPWVTREVTVRDLLAHRVAGDVGRSSGRLYYWPNSFNREDVLRRLRFLEVGTPRFRSGFVYCNECYVAVGEIVAAVAKMSWDEFVKARIFGPLQMSAAATSVYELWDAENVSPCWVCGLRGRTVGAEDARIENIVMPHVSGEGGPRPIAWIDIEAAGPAGAINASAEDLAKWLRLLLGDGVYEGKRLLSVAAVNEMFSAQVTRPPPWWHLPMRNGVGDLGGHFWAYGFGSQLTDYRGEKVVMHGGGVPGQSSFIALMPAKRLGVAVLTNKDNALPWALPFRVFDAYLDAQLQDWSAVLLADVRSWEAQQQVREEKLAAERAEANLSSFPLERCVGTYSHPAFGKVELVRGNDGIILMVSDEFSWPVEHWQADTFQIELDDGSRQYPVFLTFEFGDEGQVTALKLGSPRYERVVAAHKQE